MNTDDILTFRIDENQRHAGRFPCNHADGCNVDVVACQLFAYALAGIVITRTGDKRDIRPAASGGNRLVCALTAERHLILIASDGFARSGERFKVKNVIGIDTAKDDEVACGFHVSRCPSESATGLTRWRMPHFSFIWCPSGSQRLPESPLLLNDQFQVNRIFGLNFFALQHFIGSLHASRANLLRQLSDGRSQFAIIYCFFTIRRAVKSDNHHI